MAAAAVDATGGRVAGHRREPATWDVPTSTGIRNREPLQLDRRRGPTGKFSWGWWVVICCVHWGIVFLHVVGCCWVLGGWGIVVGVGWSGVVGGGCRRWRAGGCVRCVWCTVVTDDSLLMRRLLCGCRLRWMFWIFRRR